MGGGEGRVHIVSPRAQLVFYVLHAEADRNSHAMIQQLDFSQTRSDVSYRDGDLI